MPVTYGKEAHELCEKLWLKYGGENHDLIEAGMQKEFPSWKKKNLHDSGKGKNARHGWITKLGLDRKLKIYLQTRVEAVNNDEQDLYIGIKATRKELQKAVVAGEATRDELYSYRDFCKLEIEARKNLNLTRDNLDTFVSGWEKTLTWIGEIDPVAAKVLLKHTDKLVEMAKAHYGKEEAEFDGASNREDEGRGEPFSLLN